MGKRLKRLHCPECDTTDIYFSTWIDEYGVKPKHMKIKQPMTFCMECYKYVDKANYRTLKKQKAIQTQL